MMYARLVEVYEELGNTSGKLKKADIIAGFIRETDSENLERVILLLQGTVFPTWSEMVIGIADNIVIRIIATATGFLEKDVLDSFKETGDLGTTAEELLKKKKQMTLGTKHVTVERVFENMKKLAVTEGKGSQDLKISIVKELIMHSSPIEAKYITRTALGQLRVGVAEGIIRDSITLAFFPEIDKKEAVGIVEWAWFILSDYGEVARIAKERGIKGLKDVTLELGKPVQVQLAEKSPSIEDAINSYENPIIEFKFDGARLQIHKNGDRVWLYTRRLEDITRQFPDIVEYVKSAITAKKCVIEGEMLAIDKKTGKPMAFQMLSQRIRRKYDIERLVREIPVQVQLFDVVYVDGRMLFDSTLSERRAVLESIIKPVRGRFILAEQLIGKDIKKARDFYKQALESGQEGVMVKNSEALYCPSRRVAGGWLKVKPTMENLDLVIIGATWGTGKRTGWMGSLFLGCLNEETGEFLECGMIGTGIKEKSELEEDVTFTQLTEMLKPNIISEEGSQIKLRPSVVIEVAYEEIQKSPNYSSGYALRFPRMVRLRHDKGKDDVDTIERIGKLYEQQRGR